MSEIVICSDFFDSFGKLPSNAQNKVRAFFEKFAANNFSNGLNYEKINTINDKQLYSARIDETYRVILHEAKKEQKYYILWVDHHDEAYNWASTKKSLDLSSANIVVMNKSDYLKRGLHTKKSTNLFSSIATKDLIKLGLTISEIERVRSIPDMKTFEQYKDLFARDVYENLEWIANDCHVRDILEVNKNTKEAVLEYIKEKVLLPALNCNELDDDIKESVRDTYNRLELKDTTKEILDFFEDALLSRRGGKIHEHFQTLGLKGFEEIAEDVRRLAAF